VATLCFSIIRKCLEWKKSAIAVADTDTDTFTYIFHAHADTTLNGVPAAAHAQIHFLTLMPRILAKYFHFMPINIVSVGEKITMYIGSYKKKIMKNYWRVVARN